MKIRYEVFRKSEFLSKDNRHLAKNRKGAQVVRMGLDFEERTILKVMLRDLTELYSNNSCNDFYLEDVIPDLNMRRTFMRGVLGKDWDPEADYKIVNDQQLLSYLIKLI